MCSYKSHGVSNCKKEQICVQSVKFQNEKKKNECNFIAFNMHAVYGQFELYLFSVNSEKGPTFTFTHIEKCY